MSEQSTEELDQCDYGWLSDESRAFLSKVNDGRFVQFTIFVLILSPVLVTLILAKKIERWRERDSGLKERYEEGPHP